MKTLPLILLLLAALPAGGLAAPAGGAAAQNEIARLRAELAAKDAELARLRVVLDQTVLRTDKVAAVGAARSGREGPGASSGLAFNRAQDLGRLVSALKPGSSTCTVLATGSMKPVFDDKSVLLVEDAPFDQLKVGDIVLYRHPQLGVPVAHRLVEKDGDRFWSKGDANGRVDNVYVTRENYLKRVYAVIYTSGS